MHTKNALVIHISAGQGRDATASDAGLHGSRCTEARHPVHVARQSMQKKHGIRCTPPTASDAHEHAPIGQELSLKSTAYEYRSKALIFLNLFLIKKKREALVHRMPWADHEQVTAYGRRTYQALRLPAARLANRKALRAKPDRQTGALPPYPRDIYRPVRTPCTQHPPVIDFGRSKFHRLKQQPERNE